MTRLRRLIGADPARWTGVDERDLPSAAAIVVTTIGLLALNRFGGLVVEAPRLFVRAVAIGVWGWLGLGLASWAVDRCWPGRADRSSALLTLTIAGRAHAPVLALAVVLFIAAGVLQLRLPGLLAAFVVFGLWMPVGYVTGLVTTSGIAWRRAAVIGVVPYIGWLAVVGTHLRTQLGHLV